VSTPLRWEDLRKGLTPRDFTMEVALERVVQHGDLFAPVLEDPRPLAPAARAIAKLAP
jgi:bifunctional non-homologous end joining protein LigD